GGEVDRDARTQRVDGDLEGLAQARAALDGDAVFLALEIQRVFALPDGAQDGDVFACAGEGLAVGDAVPAFHHLRAGDTQAEQHTTATEQIQRRGGHRRVGGRARGHLQ